MLYIYTGSDMHKARAKLQATRDALRTKQPNASYVRVTEETIDSVSFEELLETQGLFKKEYIVVFDTAFTDSDRMERLSGALQACAQSTHIFLVLEETFPIAVKKKAEKYAQKVEHFDAVKKSKPESNAFALSDALLARDKKTMWVLLQKELRKGAKAEAIHGILFWGAKTMALAVRSRNAEEANMKSYPFTKARQALTKYTPREVMDTLTVLALMPTETRARGVPLEIALERWVLSSSK